MEQSRIMQKYLPLQQAKANIFPSDINFPRLADELNILEKKYADLNRQIAATPLYAGKIIKILRYLTFTASSPALPPFQTAEELKKYIVNEMNFSDLYTSGFFSAVFQVWYEANMNNPDSVLVTDAKKMLQRVDDVEINRAMSQAFINILSRYARREYLIPQIVSGINFPLNEQPAPALVINGDSILPKNALILFYDSDCGNCQNELHNLAEKYNMLKNNNIRVISIAADVDKNLFSETAQKTVWNENYCDFKGFESENFVKYGIVGTPTFILIDSNGIVRGRYAQLKELIK
jgi:peroxiredoxin